jgi:hypothetical protein
MPDGRWNRRLVGACSARMSELRLGDARDPRLRKGRWGFGRLLGVMLLGLVADRRSLAETERLTEKLSGPVRRRLGIGRRVPDTTLRDAAVRTDPEELRGRLHRQVRLARRRQALDHDRFPVGVATIDGRSTATRLCDGNRYGQTHHDALGREQHALVRTMTSTLVSSRAQVCLDACPLPPEGNEMSTFPVVLATLVREYDEGLFQVVTADAGSCSEANARLVEEAHRAYLFRMKAGEQPTLYQEAERLLGRLRPGEAAAETVDRVGTTTVTRRVWLTGEMAGFHGWEHLRTVLRVESETYDAATGQTGLEERYYLSSLRLARLSAALWLKLVRLHWGVENGNHWVFDTILKEDDRPWILEPQGLLVVMLLRRMAYRPKGQVGSADRYLVALLRSVTLRSEANRCRPWKELLENLFIALVAATEAQLAGLRLRTVPVLA